MKKRPGIAIFKISTLSRAVALPQLVEWSTPTPEIRG